MAAGKGKPSPAAEIQENLVSTRAREILESMRKQREHFSSSTKPTEPETAGRKLAAKPFLPAVENQMREYSVESHEALRKRMEESMKQRRERLARFSTSAEYKFRSTSVTSSDYAFRKVMQHQQSIVTPAPVPDLSSHSGTSDSIGSGYNSDICLSVDAPLPHNPDLEEIREVPNEFESQPECRKSGHRTQGSEISTESETLSGEEENKFHSESSENDEEKEILGNNQVEAPSTTLSGFTSADNDVSLTRITNSVDNNESSNPSQSSVTSGFGHFTSHLNRSGRGPPGPTVKPREQALLRNLSPTIEELTRMEADMGEETSSALASKPSSPETMEIPNSYLQVSISASSSCTSIGISSASPYSFSTNDGSETSGWISPLGSKTSTLLGSAWDDDESITDRSGSVFRPTFRTSWPRSRGATYRSRDKRKDPPEGLRVHLEDLEVECEESSQATENDIASHQSRAQLQEKVPTPIPVLPTTDMTSPRIEEEVPPSKQTEQFGQHLKNVEPEPELSQQEKRQVPSSKRAEQVQQCREIAEKKHYLAIVSVRARLEEQEGKVPPVERADPVQNSRGILEKRQLLGGDLKPVPVCIDLDEESDEKHEFRNKSEISHPSKNEDFVKSSTPFQVTLHPKGRVSELPEPRKYHSQKQEIRNISEISYPSDNEDFVKIGTPSQVTLHPKGRVSQLPEPRKYHTQKQEYQKVPEKSRLSKNEDFESSTPSQVTLHPKARASKLPEPRKHHGQKHVFENASEINPPSKNEESSTPSQVTLHPKARVSQLSEPRKYHPQKQVFENVSEISPPSKNEDFESSAPSQVTLHPKSLVSTLPEPRKYYSQKKELQDILEVRAPSTSEDETTSTSSQVEFEKVSEIGHPSKNEHAPSQVTWHSESRVSKLPEPRKYHSQKQELQERLEVRPPSKNEDLETTKTSSQVALNPKTRVSKLPEPRKYHSQEQGLREILDVRPPSKNEDLETTSTPSQMSLHPKARVSKLPEPTKHLNIISWPQGNLWNIDISTGSSEQPVCTNGQLAIRSGDYVRYSAEFWCATCGGHSHIAGVKPTDPIQVNSLQPTLTAWKLKARGGMYHMSIWTYLANKKRRRVVRNRPINGDRSNDTSHDNAIKEKKRSGLSQISATQRQNVKCEARGSFYYIARQTITT